MIALLSFALGISIIANVYLFVQRWGLGNMLAVLYLAALKKEVTGLDFPGLSITGTLRQMEHDGWLDVRTTPGYPERGERPKFWYRVSTRLLERQMAKVEKTP